MENSTYGILYGNADANMSTKSTYTNGKLYLWNILLMEMLYQWTTQLLENFTYVIKDLRYWS